MQVNSVFQLLTVICGPEQIHCSNTAWTGTYKAFKPAPWRIGINNQKDYSCTTSVYESHSLKTQRFPNLSVESPSVAWLLNSGKKSVITCRYRCCYQRLHYSIYVGDKPQQPFSGCFYAVIQQFFWPFRVSPQHVGVPWVTQLQKGQLEGTGPCGLRNIWGTWNITGSPHDRGRYRSYGRQRVRTTPVDCWWKVKKI